MSHHQIDPSAAQPAARPDPQALLARMNAASEDEFVALLDGIYEHSPWIARRAAATRAATPITTLAALKYRLQQVVSQASVDEQLGLIRAHPELAGKAALAGQLTRESTGEQAKAGLNACSAEEYARLHQLNRDYNAKFGFPFILAVKGPEGLGLTRQQIITTFARRLENRIAAEMAEALRQIGRIAELRLNDLFGVSLPFGQIILRQARELAQLSEDPAGLVCTYLTPSHRQTAQQLARWMQEAGLQVQIDAVGNVRGRYACGRADAQNRQTLLTGSHYDSVVDAGWYDGRLGILLPIAVLAHCRAQQVQLPFDVEVIAFAEEEGVRFQSTFLGSRALVGQFDAGLFDLCDANGISLRSALKDVGSDESAVAALQMQPQQVCGFVEVHIEQGPVLLQRDLPLGLVTAIAGSSRFWLHLTGEANHAGTTPMDLRHDAVAACAEIVLALEQRCQGVAGLVGTVGKIEVPQGAMNVVAGLCRLSLDIRAELDSVRLAAVDDIKQQVADICQRRAIGHVWQPVLEVAASPCTSPLRASLGAAIGAAGLPLFELPSGAGHDAMMMASLTPTAMLFVRCGNNGISHNPLETLTADDAELAAQVFLQFLLAQA
jgi:OHCU decarboxylase